MSEFVDDKLVKFECIECDKQFILGEHDCDTKVYCPFCKSKYVEAIVWQGDTEVQMGNCLMLHYWKGENDDV